VRSLQLPHGPGLDRLTVQETAQVVGQFSGALVAFGGLLVQALQAHRLQVGRQLRVEPARRHRLVANDLEQGVVDGGGLEGRAAGQALVQDRSQSVHVGQRPDVFFALGLSRRHVRWRSHDGAGLRHGGVAVEAFGEAEVGDLGRVLSCRLRFSAAFLRRLR
jgi:hypothetical protein